MTQIVFLGTGTPNPEPDHQGPSLAIIADGQPYIVDCGVGVVRQAMASKGRGVEALGAKNLTHAFLTHLHSDHTMGLPDIMFTPTTAGRTPGLKLFGPAGTAHMVRHIREAWAIDLAIRLHGGDEPTTPESYETHVAEFEEGPVFEDERVRVEAFKVTHGIWPAAFGFRFETKDKVIVISGDTTYNENLISHAKGCDVLIHEAYSARGLESREPEWKRYHPKYHTSGAELGRLAAIVQPKLLILYHLLPMGQPREQVCEEVRLAFDGDVRLAEDLMAIDR